MASLGSRAIDLSDKVSLLPASEDVDVRAPVLAKRFFDGGKQISPLADIFKQVREEPSQLISEPLVPEVWSLLRTFDSQLVTSIMVSMAGTLLAKFVQQQVPEAGDVEQPQPSLLTHLLQLTCGSVAADG